MFGLFALGEGGLLGTLFTASARAVGGPEAEKDLRQALGYTPPQPKYNARTYG